jgi:hypothetical protein
LLLGAGLISGTQLESALRMQKQSGRRLGAVLEEMGYISRETIETYLERQSEMRTGTACPVGRA